MQSYIITAIVILFAGYLAVQGICCRIAVKEAKRRLAGRGAKTLRLSYGDMSYIDKGEGPVILSVHGIFGGFDQAFDTCRDFLGDCRVIAPSRFGYLGSQILGGGTPGEQARAYAELLDKLGIDKVFVLATSAGGSVGIRFALDYPERTAGLILYCSAMPYPEKPEKYMEYAGPPAALCSDYAMFLIRALFKSIMGMEPSTIYGMLPIGERKAGVILDASVTNPDMARCFDDYPIEGLQVPTLILHAKDDKLAGYKDVERALPRFPNCRFISFEDGGHLMAGHGREVKAAVYEFMKNAARQ